jgi:hypothetical protein
MQITQLVNDRFDNTASIIENHFYINPDNWDNMGDDDRPSMFTPYNDYTLGICITEDNLVSVALYNDDGMMFQHYINDDNDITDFCNKVVETTKQ